MAAFNMFNQFVEDLAHGVHDLSSDQLVLAYTANANAPVAADETLSALTQISYTNASSRNVTTSASAQTSGVYKLTCADHTLTASGAVGPFQQVILYNDTPTSPADPLIAWWDYGSELTLSSGEQFTTDFDGTNGVFQLAEA